MAGLLHPGDQETSLDQPEDAERTEREDLDEHEDAVWREKLGERSHPQRCVHIARCGDHDEAHDREAGVARENRADTPAHERITDDDDRQQAAEPDGGEDEMQSEGCRCRVVAGGIGGVALKSHRHQPDGREDRDEQQERPVARREAQHGDSRRNERRHQPGLTEPRSRQELAEERPEVGVERDRLRVVVHEGQEGGGTGGDRPESGGGGGEVESLGEFLVAVAQRETDQHQGPESARDTEVDEHGGDRKTIPDDGARVENEGRLCRSAELQRGEQGHESDDQQRGWAGDPHEPWHGIQPIRAV